MAHRDCPTLADIAAANHEHHSARRENPQRLKDRTSKYVVLAIAHGQRAIHLWWSDKIHPHDDIPSFNTDSPMCMLRPDDVVNSNIWASLPRNKHIRTAIAAAIERTGLVQWPS
jgi:hypothetical protein